MSEGLIIGLVIGFLIWNLAVGLFWSYVGYSDARKKIGMTIDELEDFADDIKAAVVGALVREDIIPEDDADEWCAEHTVIFRKKSFFRTISRLWKDAPSADGLYIIIMERSRSNE